MRKGMAMSLFALALVLASCTISPVSGTRVRGSGNVTTATREVRGFNAVSLAGIGALIVQVGEAESLIIEAEDNILPHLKTDVQDQRLTIGDESNFSLEPTKPITYRLTVKSLTALALSGAGSATATGIRADQFEVELSGAGNITMAGTVTAQKVQLSGAGNYQAENLSSKQARIETSGVGQTVVNVSDSLDVQISGAGSVIYIGNPQITQHISGVGSLRQRK